MKTDLVLKIELRDAKTAKSIYSALVPDNVGVPPCMKLGTSRVRNVLKVEVDSNCPEDTFISTVDDILGSCELSLASLSSIGDK